MVAVRALKRLSRRLDFMCYCVADSLSERFSQVLDQTTPKPSKNSQKRSFYAT